MTGLALGALFGGLAMAAAALRDAPLWLVVALGANVAVGVYAVYWGSDRLVRRGPRPARAMAAPPAAPPPPAAAPPPPPAAPPAPLPAAPRSPNRPPVTWSERTHTALAALADRLPAGVGTTESLAALLERAVRSRAAIDVTLADIDPDELTRRLRQHEKAVAATTTEELRTEKLKGLRATAERVRARERLVEQRAALQTAIEQAVLRLETLAAGPTAGGDLGAEVTALHDRLAADPPSTDASAR